MDNGNKRRTYILIITPVTFVALSGWKEGQQAVKVVFINIYVSFVFWRS